VRRWRAGVPQRKPRWRLGAHPQGWHDYSRQPGAPPCGAARGAGPDPTRRVQVLAALRPLQARLYSISSSQLEAAARVAVTVAVVRYASLGRPRIGVTSTFAAERVRVRPARRRRALLARQRRACAGALMRAPLVARCQGAAAHQARR